MEGTARRKTPRISQTVTETEPPNNNNNFNSNMQQHEAQKVVALKKAYAEVILNTGKEAAARVMASERRALVYRHELESTKDEALRMLLRLKHMLDAKTAEAEMASLNQQRKIEELEAQLNEAEDVITDLRAELEQVWLELEKTKNSQVQSLDGQNIKQVSSFGEGAKPGTLVSSPNEELECATHCDVKNKSLTVNVLDDMCCNSTKQLNEAEDVITDLRAELEQVWLELEKTKNSQVQSLDGQNIKQVSSFGEGAKPGTLVSSPNEELECATHCDVKNKSLTVNVLDDTCCNSTKQTEQLCISNSDNDFSHDPDFASIIMRSKEPELCKNGCTQRVRALEGKLLDEKLLTRDEHNQHVGIKNGLIVKDSDGQVAKFSAPSTRTEKMEMKKNAKCHKKPKRKVFSYCRSCFLSSCRLHINEKCKSNKGVCSLPSIKRCAICKWERKYRRCRHIRMRSSVSEHRKLSFVLKKCLSLSDDGKCNDDENVTKMKPVPPLTDVEPVHGSTSVPESDQVVSKSELVVKAVEKDSDLLNLEGSTSQNLTGPSSIMQVEIVDIPSTNTNLENAKTFEENDGSPGRADACRLLKYTFERKRKKESLGNPDDQTDSKSTVKRRVEEIHDDVLELAEI